MDYLKINKRTYTAVKIILAITLAMFVFDLIAFRLATSVMKMIDEPETTKTMEVTLDCSDYDEDKFLGYELEDCIKGRIIVNSAGCVKNMSKCNINYYFNI